MLITIFLVIKGDDDQLKINQKRFHPLNTSKNVQSCKKELNLYKLSNKREIVFIIKSLLFAKKIIKKFANFLQPIFLVESCPKKIIHVTKVKLYRFLFLLLAFIHTNRKLR
jgi:hypothetical protein